MAYDARTGRFVNEGLGAGQGLGNVFGQTGASGGSMWSGGGLGGGFPSGGSAAIPWMPDRSTWGDWWASQQEASGGPSVAPPGPPPPFGGGLPSSPTVGQVGQPFPGGYTTPTQGNPITAVLPGVGGTDPSPDNATFTPKPLPPDILNRTDMLFGANPNWIKNANGEWDLNPNAFVGMPSNGGIYGGAHPLAPPLAQQQTSPDNATFTPASLDQFYQQFGSRMGDPSDPSYMPHVTGDARAFLTGNPTADANVGGPGWGVPSNGGIYGGAHLLAPPLAQQQTYGTVAPAGSAPRYSTQPPPGETVQGTWNSAGVYQPAR